MSFEKFAVAAWVYHRSTPKQRLRVIFSMFDSKHSGALDKADLASLLLVVTAAARQQTYRPGRPFKERSLSQSWHAPAKPALPQPPPTSSAAAGAGAVAPAPPAPPPNNAATHGPAAETAPSPAALAIAAAAAEAADAADSVQEGLAWGVGDGQEGAAEGEGGIDMEALEALAVFMADAAIARFDSDRDKKLNPAEWEKFAAAEEEDVSTFEKKIAALLTNPLVNSEEGAGANDCPPE